MGEWQLHAHLSAQGNINPHRLVKLDTSNQYGGLQATANALCVGVADGSTRDPVTPSITSPYHAESGDMIRLQHGFVVEVECGADVSINDRVKSDADGKIEPIASSGTTNQNSVGVVIEAGNGDSGANAGELVKIIWRPEVVRPAVA